MKPFLSFKKESLRRRTTTDLTKALSDVELTIEAVFEDIDVKKELFKKMDGICQKETILGSNTSTLSITESGKS